MCFNIALNPKQTMNLNDMLKTNIIIEEIKTDLDISIEIRDWFYNKYKQDQICIYVLSNNAYIKTRELYIVNNSLSTKQNVAISWRKYVEIK